MYRLPNATKTLALSQIPTLGRGWYNLETGRVVKIPDPSAWALRSLRVCGSEKTLGRFCAANQLEGEEAGAWIQPAQDIPTLCQEAVAVSLQGIPTRFVGQPVLVPFDWNHLRAPLSDIRVMDGDTFEATLTYRTKDLLRPFNDQGHVYLHKRGWPAWSFGRRSSRLILRLYGVDAQEKNTDEGQLALSFMKDKVAGYQDGELKAVLCGADKFGRTLAVIETPTGDFLNDYLIGLGRDKGVVLATPYLGGRKTF